MQAVHRHGTSRRRATTPMGPTLLSPRLRLEPLTMAHFEEMYYLNSDIKVMQYITGYRVSIDETLSHIDLVRKNWQQFGFSSWVLIELSTNAFIGSCGIQHIEFNPANPVEFGWRIKPEYWGNGFATEAARCMIQFVNDCTNIDELYAVCHQENKKSMAVMKRLAMQNCGIQNWYGLATQVYKINRSQYLDSVISCPAPATSLSSQKLLQEVREKNSTSNATDGVNTNS